MLIVQNLSGKMADTILCADIFQKKFLQENGLVSKKIEVFMNLPVQNKFIWIGPSENLSPARFVYHGTLTHRLGLDIAIKAIYYVKDRIKVRFDILGEGDIYDDLNQLIIKLNLQNEVFITGKMIANEKIPGWVNGACGSIIPNRRTFSTDNFMLPHKMLEYIKLGVPVIAPRLKIIDTYMTDEQIIFFEPENVEDLANAIIKLLNSDRNAQAKKALKFFDMHNYDNNKIILKSILT